MISQSTYRALKRPLMHTLRAILLAAAFVAGGTALHGTEAHADGLSFGTGGATATLHLQGYVSRPLLDASSDQDNARNAVKAGSIMSLEQILPRVRARFPGQHLDSRLVQAGGRPVYKVKMRMNDGSVKIVTVDARSGRILGAR